MTKILTSACLLSMMFLSGSSPAAAQDNDSHVRVVVTEGVKARVAVADIQQRGSQEELERHTSLFDDVPVERSAAGRGVRPGSPRASTPCNCPRNPTRSTTRSGPLKTFRLKTWSMAIPTCSAASSW